MSLYFEFGTSFGENGINSFLRIICSETYPSFLTLKEVFSKIIPSFFVDKVSCTRQFECVLSLHSLASLFPIKEGSTFLTKPLFPQGREDVTALRCSEPLRSKVGGTSKPFAILCGMGPLGNSSLQFIVYS